MKYFYLTLITLIAFVSHSQSYNFSAIDNLLNSNTNLFNGKVVCIIKQGDKLIYYKQMGGIDSLSVSQIASATKTFSGALILRLVQEGLFNLNDSIGKYKPNATLFGKGSSTIRQNFSHTAGWDGSTNYHSSNTLTLQEACDSIIKNDPQIYVPGTSFKYSGVSMHVVGAIAEQLSGTSWNTLFKTKIKIPLGLSNTSFFPNSNNPRIAGGISSSPADIMKFARFILHNGKNENNIQVVDSLFMQEMWKDQTNGVPQMASPYPTAPTHNNPYNQADIGYGIGSWQDIYNPASLYQEQISGAGAFGTTFWINRCTNITGVLFTVIPTNYIAVNQVWFEIMDIVRNAVPNNCNNLSDEDFNANNFKVVPNPFHDKINVINSTGNETYSLTNLLGQVIYSGTSINEQNLSFLKSGIYFLKITNENKKQTTIKLIKE